MLKKRNFNAFIIDTFASSSVSLLKVGWCGIRDEFLYGVSVNYSFRLGNTVCESLAGKPYGIIRNFLLKRSLHN